MPGGYWRRRAREGTSVLLAVAVAACARVGPRSSVLGPAGASPAYLFSYFRGNGDDGVHLAWSADGITWSALNGGKSVITPNITGDGIGWQDWNSKAALMRDPSIIYGPDKQFHMVWTVAWTDHGIGVAHSPDLIHWSEQARVPVMEHEPTALNAWAPDYLNEDLVPAYMDDVELCFRAYEKKGMKSGVFWIGFRSDEAWGKSREKIDGMPRIDWNPIIRKNSRYISEHYPKFTSYASHIDEERYVQDSNIDYIEQDSLLIRFGHRFFIDFQNTKTYLAKKQHALKVRLQTNSIHKFLSRRMRTSISRRIGRARNAWSKFSYRAKLRLGIKRPPHNVAELNSLLLHSRAYLHDLEVPVLAACAKSSPGTIVEIGSAFGASSSILLSNMPGGAVLHSTDPFIVDSMGDTLHASKKTCSANVRNVLTTLGMADRLNKWNMHADYSHNVIKTWVMPIDMIFIDGDHRYPAVKQDFEQWFPFVKKGGLILFHDSRKEKSTPEETFNRGWAGPTQLADELRKDPRVALVKEAFSITVWKKN